MHRLNALKHSLLLAYCFAWLIALRIMRLPLISGEFLSEQRSRSNGYGREVINIIDPLIPRTTTEVLHCDQNLLLSTIPSFDQAKIARNEILEPWLLVRYL